MKLKPKTTYLNQRALLYRRYNDLEQSFSLMTIYKTADNKFWAFDTETLSFSLTTNTGDNHIQNIVNFEVYQYKDSYFMYDNGWGTATPSTLTAQLGFNIAKYQTNRYYFVSAFSYIRKGSEQGSTTQVIKGNIAPLRNFDIQTYDDTVNLRPDDLVVIDKHLYFVENPVVDRKYQPKPFNIYTATLNNIL